MQSKASINVDVSFPVYLTILFVILKLINVIGWSWFWVFFPMIFAFALFFLLLVVVAIVSYFNW